MSAPVNTQSRRTKFFAELRASHGADCAECGRADELVTRVGPRRTVTQSILEWAHVVPRNGDRAQLITRMGTAAARRAVANGEVRLLCNPCHTEFDAE